MSSSRFRLRGLGAVACVAALAALAACSSGGGSTSSNSNSGTVTVAVVSNPLITGQMIPLTTSNFEKQYPGIKVKFATYTEGDLRAAIEKSVSTHSNAFNVIMIGPYEAPLFAKNGWLTDLSKQYIASDPGYDAADLLQPIAKSLSYKGDLYAVPFYGESSMMFYNKTLFAQAGLTMPQHPTWSQIQTFAAKLNQPGKVAGICLRGLAGWGDNMAALDTVVNTFGGQWFDMGWKPQLTSPPFVQAANFYVNLVRKYGESGASNDSFNQLLTLYGQGKCAMWYDATVAATSIATTYPDVYKQTGYALAPVNLTKSSGWLWTWALGIPQGASATRAPPGSSCPGRPPSSTTSWSRPSTAGPRSRRAPGPRSTTTRSTRRRPSRSRPSRWNRSTRPTRSTRPCTRCRTPASSSSTSRSSRASA